MLWDVGGLVWDWASRSRERLTRVAVSGAVLLALVAGGATFVLTRPASAADVCASYAQLATSMGAAATSGRGDDAVFEDLSALSSRIGRLPESASSPELEAAGDELGELADARTLSLLQLTTVTGPVATYCAGSAVAASRQEPVQQAPARQPEPEPEPAEEVPAEEVPAVGDDCAFEVTGEASRPVSRPSATPGELPTTAVLTTSLGDLSIALDPAAPCTVSSFAHLIREGFYDSTACHRLTTVGIRVLQCGDPTGTGTGGPGYRFADENLDGATYPRGTLAMANNGPGTNGSQFFLVHGDSDLPPDYTPFGRVTQGLELLDDVARAGSDESSAPGDGRPTLRLELDSAATS